MLKKILILSTIISLKSFSQKHIIIDALDKKPLEFVTIRFSKGGFYSNENGVFFLETKTIDKIYFSHVNYFDLEIEGSECNDTIKLQPKSNYLQEVLVTQQEIKRINYLKQAKSFSSFPLDKNTEILTFVKPNDRNLNTAIKRFHFKGAMARGINEDTSFKSVVRVNFYNVQNDKIIDRIYSSKPIFVLPNIDKEFSVDLTKEIIEFNNDGLAFGIENIGVINSNGNFVENKNHIRIALTNKTSDDYKQTTYLRFTFLSTTMMLLINKAIQIDEEKYSKYNLSFSLDLIK